MMLSDHWITVYEHVFLCISIVRTSIHVIRVVCVALRSWDQHEITCHPSMTALPLRDRLAPRETLPA